VVNKDFEQNRQVSLRQNLLVTHSYTCAILTVAVSYYQPLAAITTD